MKNFGCRRCPPLVALAALAFLLLACGPGGGSTPRATPTPSGGAQNPYPLLHEVQADPAAILQMPGADELDQGGRERGRNIHGAQPPTYGLIFGTQASADEVYAFYDRELRQLGWTPVPNGAMPSSVELQAWLWCGPRAVFRLGIEEPDRAYQPSLYRGKTYRTVFNPQLIGHEPGVACPGS